MDKEDIIAYVTKTPMNTNPNILRGMLEFLKPQGGTINITTNGTKDVAQYASANVQVPASAVVSGTYTATSNGTFDVTNYAYVQISVPTYAGEIEEITE
jgi:hypothetical protein